MGFQSQQRIHFADENDRAQLEFKIQNSKLSESIKGETLNSYLAKCGVASRRKSVELIKTGKVKVNGAVITNAGYRVRERDKILCEGKLLSREKKIYLLLNKPKDTLCTSSDERGRPTVFDLIKFRTNERLFTIGRLDRNTTGVLIITNDGQLAQRLSHPSYELKKEYLAFLNKPITEEDAEKIQNGIELDDGLIKPDQIAPGNFPEEVKITLHSGRNRIVRRIFEHLGYEVLQLERTKFAGLNRKGIKRGQWRELNFRELNYLMELKSERKIRKS